MALQSFGGGKKWTFPHPTFRLSRSVGRSRGPACLLSWFWHRWSLGPTAGETVCSRDHDGVALRCSTEPDVGMLCSSTWNSDRSCGHSLLPLSLDSLCTEARWWKGSLETGSQRPWQLGAQGLGLGVKEVVRVIWLKEWNQPWALGPAAGSLHAQTSSFSEPTPHLLRAARQCAHGPAVFIALWLTHLLGMAQMCSLLGLPSCLS